MNERGLSDIVTNVLIILLVLVGIGIMWFFLRPFFSSTSEIEGQNNCFSISLHIDQCSQNPENNQTIVSITRLQGKGTLNAISFIFNNGTQKKVTKSYPLPQELDKITYSFNTSEISNALTVDIASVVEGKTCQLTGAPISCQSPNKGNQFLRTTTYAYAWDTPASVNTPNLVPFYWIGAKWYGGGGFEAPNVTAASEEMLRRASLGIPLAIADVDSYQGNFGLIDTLGENASDYCTTSLNEKFSCIFWERSVSQVQAKYLDFFTNLSATGAKVSVIALDFEPGFTNWEIGSTPSNLTEQRYWAAIQNDPRFTQQNIASRLGFNNLSSVHDFSNPLNTKNYSKWNSVMSERKAEYLNNATYSILKQFYPNIKMSNYDQFDIDSNYYVPDYNGHNISARSITNGIVGTHQSPYSYGWLGTISTIKVDGTNFYAKTPFNALKRDINTARAAHLSSSAPLSPWIAWRSYSNTQTYLNNSEYYQELILHLGLTGTDYFLYFNPNSTHPTPPELIRKNQTQEDKLLSDTLYELDEISGFTDKSSLVANLAGWNDDYLLTGVSAGGQKVWRFTPQQTPMIVSNSTGVFFQTPTTKISILQGQIWTPSAPISSIGVWITQPLSAPSPIIQNS